MARNVEAIERRFRCADHSCRSSSAGANNDDRAWLGCTIAVRGGMPSHELSLEPQVSEIPRLTNWVETCCGASGLANDLAFKMALAIEEAVMNVISHAFTDRAPPYMVKIRLDITPKLFAAEVIDNGRPFDPTAAPDPDLSLPLEQRDPGGLGIHLMREMTDRLLYRRSNGHNVLRLEKARA
jgi:anti-sigma regulatory factor (Ser/Thr protein kinase)